MITKGDERMLSQSEIKHFLVSLFDDVEIDFNKYDISTDTFQVKAFTDKFIIYLIFKEKIWCELQICTKSNELINSIEFNILELPVWILGHYDPQNRCRNCRFFVSSKILGDVKAGIDFCIKNNPERIREHTNCDNFVPKRQIRFVKYYDIVYDVIEKYDPVGLAIIPNEYELEIVDICKSVNFKAWSEEKIAEKIYDIFAKRFNKELLDRKKVIFKEIAKEIKEKVKELDSKLTKIEYPHIVDILNEFVRECENRIGGGGIKERGVN